MDRLKLLKLTDILPRPWEYKQKDLLHLEKLKNCLLQYGQLKNIVVRQKNAAYEIIDGQRLYEALKLLNVEHAFCLDLGAIPCEEAKLLCLALNEYLPTRDYIEVAKALSFIHSRLPKLKTINILPYSLEEIENLENLLTFSFEEFTKKTTSQLSLFTHEKK